NELQLIVHPTVVELSQGDSSKNQATPVLDFLSEQELQILFFRQPLSVLADKKENAYILLERSLPVELLKQHPCSHLCSIYLHVYTEIEAEVVIKTTLLQHAALQYRQFDSIANNLFNRRGNANSLKLSVPTLRQLSTLSNLSATNFRPKKKE
ncbi:MAG: hypothetical protein HAW66_08680, partial [Shewanella sp.]|nr:hypothetical protein [Shewanella sp.]